MAREKEQHEHSWRDPPRAHTTIDDSTLRRLCTDSSPKSERGRTNAHTWMDLGGVHAGGEKLLGALLLGMDAALADALDELALQRRAEEEERRADAQWRELQLAAQRRNEEAEEAALAEKMAARSNSVRPRPYALAPCTSCAPSSSRQRDDDEPDGAGWTPREQRALEAALRANPAANHTTKNERWQAIAAQVPNHSAKECVARCRQLSAAVRASLPPPLLRLDADLLLSVLSPLTGKDLCAVACVNKELCEAAHDDLMWMPIADALPAKWAYSKRDRGDEPPWKYTLRMRDGLYGAWRKLNDHRAGACPYLCDIGRVERGAFIPNGKLDYRVTYGAICELVQLEARRQDGLNHRVYKAVAEDLVRLSPNPRSVVPPDLHMTVREIYKTCYPGHGAGVGSGAYAPGLQAGGSSTKASTSGTMLGKGMATMMKKASDEDMRKRLVRRQQIGALNAPRSRPTPARPLLCS